MKRIAVKIYNESNNENPRYATENDTGCDVKASMPHTLKNFNANCGRNWTFDTKSSTAIIHPGGIGLIGTGIFCEMPAGWGVAVRPRSGLALKSGITVGNSPGTIDSDYRGEFGVILINHSDEDFIVSEGDRIAQLVIEEVSQISWIEACSKNDLSETERSDGSYGHTGVED